MPSNKTFITLIICFAVVTSTWLLLRTPEEVDSKSVENGAVAARPYIEGANMDWKKLLTSSSTSSQIVTSIINSGENYEETTLTAQMSRDFLSQYLLLKQGNRDLTPEDTAKIAQGVLALPQYNTQTGAVYIASNLHVTKKGDRETIKKYRDIVNVSLKKWSTKIESNPVNILTEALKTENPEILSKLDPLIVIAKGLVGDFLSIEVPESAVTVHLNLLNSFSRLLSNIESMREALTDPVKTMSSMGEYNQNIANFTSALKGINLYFIQKLGSQY